jgi:spore maturation protein B
VFGTFLDGAQKGIRTAIHLLPTLLALLVAVNMLQASGAVDLAGNALQPLFVRLGIPQECAALVLLKPLSGSGGLTLGSEIMQKYGVDSRIGRTAAVMLGASETSFYTIGIYTGHLSLKHTRWLIPAAMIADIAAFTTAAFFVHLLG